MTKDRLTPFGIAHIAVAALSFAAALLGIVIGWFSEGNTVYGLFTAEGKLLTVRIFAVCSLILAGISAMTVVACTFGAAKPKFFVKLAIGVLTVLAASLTLGFSLSFVEEWFRMRLAVGGYLLPIASMLCGVLPLPAKDRTKIKR